MKQIIELFPSIIESYFYPEWVDIATEVSNETLQNSTMTGSVTHGHSIHGEPKLKPLVETVGKHSKEFLISQGYSFDNYVLMFESFWPQIFSANGGGHHEFHVHQNSHVSGFYFLKCSPKSSYPVFYDPRFGKTMTQLVEKDSTFITPASSQVHFKPVPGTLFIFNSFLPHSFVYDSGKEPFQFMHFTMIALPKHYVLKDEK